MMLSKNEDEVQETSFELDFQGLSIEHGREITGLVVQSKSYSSQMIDETMSIQMISASKGYWNNYGRSLGRFELLGNQVVTKPLV